jgi:ABC-2 type transport system ATP-binding protein
MNDFPARRPQETPAVSLSAAVMDAPPPASFSVEAEGLVKQFGTKAAVTTAVDNISVRVREGEFFGFLGPNGAGKSTTIRMLCGLLKPTAGRIRVAGLDLATQALEVKRFIGVLPEEASLYERLTGREFLIFAGRMYGLPKPEAERRTDDLLHLMELDEARDKMIVDYSMGMKKKTALASALIHRPRVLFLDEPFNGIDPISVRAIRTVLRQLTDRGTTIFFSSHVMEVVERLCTRVAIINHGRIVAEGTLDELRDQAQSGGNAHLEDVFLKLVEARVDSEETLSWL